MKFPFIPLMAAILIIVGCSQPILNIGNNEKMTQTGFYWPTGTSNLGDLADWLGDPM